MTKTVRNSLLLLTAKWRRFIERHNFWVISHEANLFNEFSKLLQPFSRVFQDFLRILQSFICGIDAKLLLFCDCDKRREILLFTKVCAANFICWPPNPQCHGIRKESLWEVSKFRWNHKDETSHGISVLIRRGRTRAPPPPALSLSFSMWGHRECSHLPVRKKTLTRNSTCLYLDLRCSAP